MNCILNNKEIGYSISKYRKYKEVKAAVLADYLGMSESAFTKYERGETQITVEFISRIGAFFKVDGLLFITTVPDEIIGTLYQLQGDTTLTAQKNALSEELFNQLKMKDMQIAFLQGQCADLLKQSGRAFQNFQ